MWADIGASSRDEIRTPGSSSQRVILFLICQRAKATDVRLSPDVDIRCASHPGPIRTHRAYGWSHHVFVHRPGRRAPA